MTDGAPTHQLAMVFDLNKCLGCQTCTVACKTQWTRGPGMEAMWWNIVNTVPGRGTPRDAFDLGGGYRDGEPVPGELPPKRPGAKPGSSTTTTRWRDATGCDRASTTAPPRGGDRTGTRTSAAASTRTRTSSTCPCCA